MKYLIMLFLLVGCGEEDGGMILDAEELAQLSKIINERVVT